MVAASTARRVLQALASVLPDDGADLVTRVDIHDGWGGAIHVRVHTGLDRARHKELATQIRQAVGRELNVRHRVELVWAAAPV